MWAGFVGEAYPDVLPQQTKRTFFTPQTTTSLTFEEVSQVLTSPPHTHTHSLYESEDGTSH